MYTLGLDFGTGAVRACLMDCGSGEVVATATCAYAGGTAGTYTDESRPLLARQSPLAYLDSLESVGKQVVAAFKEKGLDTGQIIGIGVDATASTPIPVLRELTPLAAVPAFKDNLNAFAWLWKDHTAVNESLKITEMAAKHRPEYLAKCGGAYSSEWFWSKVWHCLNADPEVFAAAYSWVEQSDFIPGVLAGITDVHQLKRNVCAAGHKAMYAQEWGGLPDADFLAMLDPALAYLRDCLYDTAHDYREAVGGLCPEWAEKFGLPEGVPVAVGAIDAHVGAIGAGVGKGRFVKIIGTSTCDIMAFPEEEAPGDFPGVAGLVRGSVIPGQIGLEAGQAAVGDLLDWWVRQVLGKDAAYHATLTEKAARLKAGESGLLALDWNNGNRNILGDQQLTGLMIGQTLATTDFEIYRALIEGTAFGAKKIIELIESQGVRIEQVVVTGGIGHKNELFMQIYADVLGYPVHLVDNPETVAVGAAIMGAVAANAVAVNAVAANAVAAKKVGSPLELIQRLSVPATKVYRPEPNAQAVYRALYLLYSDLHDAFGRPGFQQVLYGTMKSLIAVREAQQHG